MTTMQTTHRNTIAATNHLRVILALASKDIVDALKNKSTLSVIIISVLMVAFYRFFPSLTQDEPHVWVYSATESPVVDALERSPAFAMYSTDSEERMLRLLRESETPEIALVIDDASASFSAETDSTTPLVIDGYIMHWLTDEQRTELINLVESELALDLGRPVMINVAGHELYRSAEEGVLEFSASVALLFVVTMIGISLIPNLMLEEKQAKTLDALMVAPVSPADLVAGKALAGAFYGMVGSLMVLFIFRYIIVLWPLAMLSALLGVLFMTAIGLLLGNIIESRAQLQLVAWFVILPLMIPPILILLEGLIPNGVIGVLRWIPTVSITAMYRLSFTIDAGLSHIWRDLVVVAVVTLALFALVVVSVRRQDMR
ncbi:MAG: ABC transporter permease [Anaerolineae bacterium]|nr:ABC transporter permease [Anaerolineae bacterium]